ncbi:MAG: hypothetical protein U9N52_13460 [Campylobacterota bacterium]|nr:hypothetical protein [Campylobacterota bacterium]
MLSSLYRTLFTYTIFRKYFTSIFIILLGLVSIIEISFFYSDIFQLAQNENPTLFIQTLFGLKWTLIFGFTLYFFYSFYSFKPKKRASKKIIEKEPIVKKEKQQDLSPNTEAKLERLLHKKKLQTHADKIIQS